MGWVELPFGLSVSEVERINWGHGNNADDDVTGCPECDGGIPERVLYVHRPEDV
jgi:hypothetical protein